MMHRRVVTAMLAALAAAAALLPAGGALAAPGDWAEGTPGLDNGASRDYYNRAGLIPWDNFMGDWADASGTPQGGEAYATTTVADDDSGRFVEWDVTALVQLWVDASIPNKGMLLRAVGGGGTYNFRSKEYADEAQRPRLAVTIESGTQELAPAADTYLDESTYRCMGNEEMLRVTDSSPTLLRFDLGAFTPLTVVQGAVLRIFTYEQYGDGTIDIGVFRCNQGHEEPPSDPLYGLSASYDNDEGIAGDPDVLFFADFESDAWRDGWTFAEGGIDTVESDPALGFEPLRGKALRVLMAGGGNDALNMGYHFLDETGAEPEEIYVRYYLRFASDWNQTVDGGKMPGIAGTYGVAGWGGRPSDGTNGWSARGSYGLSIPSDNPLGGTTPIGTYCYHADMEGDYGDIWYWLVGYRGFIPDNVWVSVEQYLRMNTLGASDGVLRSWIDGRPAFEKTDLRFRSVDTLKIEEIWMNVYHGGTAVSPYDQHLFIDNVVIARSYIGPMAGQAIEPYPEDSAFPDTPADVAVEADAPAPDVPPSDALEDEPGGGSSSGCGCTLAG